MCNICGYEALLSKIYEYAVAGEQTNDEFVRGVSRRAQRLHDQVSRAGHISRDDMNELDDIEGLLGV